MTQNEIIEMAKQVGFEKNSLGMTYTSGMLLSHLEAFAKLITKKEREACAKVCDVLSVHPEYASSITKFAAKAIRNRG